jgi:hypothetical protein
MIAQTPHSAGAPCHASGEPVVLPDHRASNWLTDRLTDEPTEQLIDRLTD